MRPTDLKLKNKYVTFNVELVYVSSASKYTSIQHAVVFTRWVFYGIEEKVDEKRVVWYTIFEIFDSHFYAEQTDKSALEKNEELCPQVNV